MKRKWKKFEVRNKRRRKRKSRMRLNVKRGEEKKKE
jgi:hypothetical protein